MNTRKTKSFFALVLVFFMFLPAFALSEVPSVSLGAGSLLPGNTVWLGFYSVGHEDGNGEQIRSEEPLRWRVLRQQDGSALLISETTVPVWSPDVTFYNMYPEAAYYEENFIPNWEESAVMEQFLALYEKWSGNCPLEAEALLPVSLTDAESYTGGHFGTEYLPSAVNGARFFPLSAEEADTLFASDADRAATDPSGNPAWWWLRSPVNVVSIYIDHDYFIGAVDDAGWVSMLGALYPNTCSLRPACSLDLSAVLLVSAVPAGKPSPSSDPALREIVSGDYAEWKLTLLDRERTFTASADPLAAAPGSTVRVAYQGAASGENEAVSVLLCGSDRVPLYYGSVPALSSGTAEFVLPENLPAGEYVLEVFNERQNGLQGTHACDYASAFTEIALTVQ